MRIQHPRDCASDLYIGKLCRITMYPIVVYISFLVIHCITQR